MRNNYRVEYALVFIELKKRDGSVRETVVDLNDLGKLLNFDINWCCLENNGNTCYVMAKMYSEGPYKGKTVHLHRFLTDAPQGLVVNHINGDGLDNRKINLEVVSIKENTTKRVFANKNNKSGVRGVYYRDDRNQWVVSFKKNYKTVNYGSFDNFEDAKKVAENAVIELFGL